MHCGGGRLYGHRSTRTDRQPQAFPAGGTVGRHGGAGRGVRASRPSATNGGASRPSRGADNRSGSGSDNSARSEADNRPGSGADDRSRATGCTRAAGPGAAEQAAHLDVGR